MQSDSGISDQLLTTNRKALTINLDESKYGTFAEIGAGQEVARCFFQAGAASGTIAKTISAYDMKFSDEIYGKCGRYVSNERLQTMLDHECALLRERLMESRGARTTFFTFADTVAARNFKGTNECHGWMGIRFQLQPEGEWNDIVIHVRMWDRENVLQQQALGVIGVNLIYGAFYYHSDPNQLVASLIDNLSTDRIEVDMIKFSGPDFQQVDNRLLSLQLVQRGMTNAVMFSPNGDVLQPSEVLYKKAILVERGNFRPVTKVNCDMLDCAAEQFAKEAAVQGIPIVTLWEMTMTNLLVSGELDHRDFLARVDVLGALGHDVLISNYPEYFRLTTYFRRYTKEMIGVTMGVNHLSQLFNEKYYEDLQGGILESFGRLFRHSVRLYVYPMRTLDGDALSTDADAPVEEPFTHEGLITAGTLEVAAHLRHLYAHLLENHFIEPLTGFDDALLDLPYRDVLSKIVESDPAWEDLVPPDAAAIIKQRGLFAVGNVAP